MLILDFVLMQVLFRKTLDEACHKKWHRGRMQERRAKEVTAEEESLL